MSAGERSEALFERALRVIPGGVNSPVRAFGAVGGTPIFVRRASGAVHSRGPRPTTVPGGNPRRRS